MNEHIRKMLYKRYITPTEKKRDRRIGVEIEMPIVNLTGEATDHDVCRQAFNTAAAYFGFIPHLYDQKGRCHEAMHRKTGDLFSFDCSYNNLEISFGPEKSLIDVASRFASYVGVLNAKLEADHHLLTGMGISPYYKKCRKDFIPCGRYQMLEGYLKKATAWKKAGGFHPYNHFASFASATQVQLDVKKENLIQTLKALSLVEPIKSLLFANSVMEEDEPGTLCVRDELWRYSTHGINQRNVGLFAQNPETIDELIDYIAYTSIFCAERDGKYLFFYPIPIAEYFERDTIVGEYYENGRYLTCSFKPEHRDINYLRTYKHLDLTARGTIEYRSLCTQPLSEAFSAIAFQIGLSEKIPELSELFSGDAALYHHGLTANELRCLFNHARFPNTLDERRLRNLIKSVIALSEEGLKTRGYGEEVFLESVYDRAERLSSPAKDMQTMLNDGVPMNDIIYDYAAL